jgi:serine/threonine-protein kinase
MNCNICNHSNRPKARFCANCAAPLSLQNKYRITRLLGRGGFGSVYLAEHLNLAGKCYAIKELVLDPSATPAERQQAESQFRLEATLLAKLDHPNLPKVWDFFSENDRHYLVMEYVEGETLEARLTHAGAPLPEADVLQWTRALLDALGYLHAQKPPVIHRDVNPRNVKIAPDGKLKLIDFGIAKLFATGAGTGAAARAVSAPYSPMEQYGGGTDARSDIYALGATLYHLLTNHLPPDAPSRAIQSLTPPRQLNFALSDATEAIILKAMAINAADRFPSAADMQAAMHPPVPAATVSASRASVVRRLLARFSTWLRRAQTPLWAVGIIVLVLVLCESALLFYVQSDVQSAQKNDPSPGDVHRTSKRDRHAASQQHRGSAAGDDDADSSDRASATSGDGASRDFCSSAADRHRASTGDTDDSGARIGFRGPGAPSRARLQSRQRETRSQGRWGCKVHLRQSGLA